MILLAIGHTPTTINLAGQNMLLSCMISQEIPLVIGVFMAALNTALFVMARKRVGLDSSTLYDTLTGIKTRL